MSLADVAASLDAVQRHQVMHATWGHLAPPPRKRYPGHMVFAHTEYGDLVPIVVQFADLPDSPWFCDAVHDFVADKAVNPGQVYRFDGVCYLQHNGRFRFSGTVRPVAL